MPGGPQGFSRAEWLARLVSQADCSGSPISPDHIPELEAFWRELRRHAKGWGVRGEVRGERLELTPCQ